MRILYLSEGYTSHDYNFCRELGVSGFTVCHARLGGPAYETRPLPPGAFHVPWSGEGRHPWWTRLAHFPEFVRRIQPQVVLAGPIPSGAGLAAFWSWLVGPPLVSMSWGSDILVHSQRNRWLGFLTCLTLRRSAGGLCDCRAVEQRMQAIGRFPPGRLVMFPWGVDLQHFAPGPGVGLRTRLGWQRERVLISCRSWEPIYRIDLLLRAFHQVRPEFPQARLLLLGDGSQAGMIQELLDELELRGVVHLAGRQPNDRLVNFFREADVYVSSALSDGSSVSLLEALATGLPSIVSRVGGNAEWVEPGREGWLYSAGCQDELAACLREACSMDPASLAAMSGNCRATAEERADWKGNFPRLANLLRQVAQT